MYGGGHKTCGGAARLDVRPHLFIVAEGAPSSSSLSSSSSTERSGCAAHTLRVSLHDCNSGSQISYACALLVCSDIRCNASILTDSIGWSSSSVSPNPHLAMPFQIPSSICLRTRAANGGCSELLGPASPPPPQRCPPCSVGGAAVAQPSIVTALVNGRRGLYLLSRGIGAGRCRYPMRDHARQCAVRSQFGAPVATWLLETA